VKPTTVCVGGGTKTDWFKSAETGSREARGGDRARDPVLCVLANSESMEQGYGCGVVHVLCCGIPKTGKLCVCLEDWKRRMEGRGGLQRGKAGARGGRWQAGHKRVPRARGRSRAGAVR